jgi:ribosomal protein L7Ae-like RNA K-turn-binding protein
MKRNRIKLLIVAVDAAKNTKDRIYRTLANEELKKAEKFTKLQLGSILGKGETSVIGITDVNFANGIIEKISKEN